MDATKKSSLERSSIFFLIFLSFDNGKVMLSSPLFKRGRFIGRSIFFDRSNALAVFPFGLLDGLFIFSIFPRAEPLENEIDDSYDQTGH